MSLTFLDHQAALRGNVTVIVIFVAHFDVFFLRSTQTQFAGSIGSQIPAQDLLADIIVVGPASVGHKQRRRRTVLGDLLLSIQSL